MSIKQDRGDFVEAENNERETARVYLRVLSDGHRRLFGMLKETQECLENKINKETKAAFQEWISLVGQEMKHWFGAMEPAMRHLIDDPKMAKFVSHDIRGEAANAVGYSYLLSGEIDKDEQHQDLKRFGRDLRIFINHWERYWVPVQDVLLRNL